MIVLITPTGARQMQFDLCTYFMKRQTYPGNVTWIIIDDCNPRTTDNVGEGFRDNWTIIKVYPTPLWDGRNTQARNLGTGIDVLLNNFKREDVEAIFMIEDDDYYKPIYIERMLLRLKGFWAAGEMNTIYYNVLYNSYADNNNRAHSSLFQTAFTYDAIPIFQQCLPAKFIDAHFFMIMDKTKVNLFNEGNLAVGMKGLPGRKGIGAGHNRMVGHPIDHNFQFLKSIIGEDAKFYEGSYRGGSFSQYDILTKKRL
ncbi:MAG: glycosyltransferase family 2 protein [Bacteroidales bacterium]|nr:glycosyltransferase family 2 protein [Bacteroidales bacterium]